MSVVRAVRLEASRVDERRRLGRSKSHHLRGTVGDLLAKPRIKVTGVPDPVDQSIRMT
jgi:hypothetical protein